MGSWATGFDVSSQDRNEREEELTAEVRRPAANAFVRAAEQRRVRDAATHEPGAHAPKPGKAAKETIGPVQGLLFDIKA